MDHCLESQLVAIEVQARGICLKHAGDVWARHCPICHWGLACSGDGPLSGVSSPVLSERCFVLALVFLWLYHWKSALTTFWPDVVALSKFPFLPEEKRLDHIVARRGHPE